jgi:hypothetical protein
VDKPAIKPKSPEILPRFEIFIRCLSRLNRYKYHRHCAPVVKGLIGHLNMVFTTVCISQPCATTYARHEPMRALKKQGVPETHEPYMPMIW